MLANAAGGIPRVSRVGEATDNTDVMIPNTHDRRSDRNIRLAIQLDYITYSVFWLTSSHLCKVSSMALAVIREQLRRVLFVLLIISFPSRATLPLNRSMCVTHLCYDVDG